MGEGLPERGPLRSAAGGHDLEALYRSAGPELWRALYGFSGGRRQVAEDAVAEAFARAIEHENDIRGPLAWIYRTAFRLALRELERERRRPPAAPDPVPGIDIGGGWLIPRRTYFSAHQGWGITSRARAASD